MIIRVFFISLFFLASCDSEKKKSYLSAEKVLTAINEANNCKRSSDCISIGSYCGVGCNIAVNKENAEDIKKLTERVPPCKLRCSKYAIIACQNNKCKAGIKKESKRE